MVNLPQILELINTRSLNSLFKNMVHCWGDKRFGWELYSDLFTILKKWHPTPTPPARVSPWAFGACAVITDVCQDSECPLLSGT